MDASVPCGAQASVAVAEFSRLIAVASCCRAQAVGAQASGAVAPGVHSEGSAVVVHRLRCSGACGIF